MTVTKGMAGPFWFGVIILLLLFPLISSAAEEDQFTDWDQLDWKFWRHTLAKAYLFQRLRVSDAFSKYEEKTWYSAPLEAVDLEEFLSLSPEAQEHRRDLAQDEHYQAMALRRIVDRGWEIWIMSLRLAVPEEAMVEEMGIITPAIKHLKNATGLDPSNPVPWYDLCYFAGVVGDRVLQAESLEKGLAALELHEKGNPKPIWQTSENLARLRLRILLDQGWTGREAGYYQAALGSVKEAIGQMAGDDLRTLDEAREAMLLQALLMVDLGNIHDARQLARKLPEWPLPLQVAPGMYNGTKPAMRKENLEHIESKFAHNWVWTMTFLQQEEKDQALARISGRDYLTEFPPHINYRFWQDRGRVLEHFGERSDARLAYGFSIIYHPYFPYFPLQGARGISRVLDQTGTGETYYLGYQNFYVSGSFYSYAANRIVTMEMAEDYAQMKRQAEMAVDALSTCLRQGLKPASALALRGRAHYRLGNQEEALADLREADERLLAEDRESPRVVKLAAIIHFDRKEFDDCLTWLERYVRLEPGDGFGWRLSGLALANLDRLDEAVNVLNRAVNLDPTAVPGWYNLAVVHLKRGEVDRAQAVLVEAATHFKSNQDIARLQQLIRDNPDTQIELTSGQVELRTARTDSLWFAQSGFSSGLDLTARLSKAEAKNLLPELRENYRNDPDPENRLTLVRTLVHTGGTLEVQELLGPLWPDQLSHEEALQLLIADRDRKWVQRALTSARSLRTDANPYPDSQFWTLVGLICLENGAPEEARLALDLARELDPDNASLQLLR